MKRLLLLFFLIISLASNAADVKINGIYYELNTSNYTAKVKACQGDYYSGDIVIPSSVYSSRSYSVTSIGNYAFDKCSGLTSVTIPNSITSIGEYAFRGCSALTSVTIPNSVTSIGSSAFDECSALTSVTIPNSVTSIGSYAFYGCSGLTSVSIPNSVTSIGSYAFCGCSGLTSVSIPNSVTRIVYSAFSGCSGLTSVSIPNSVTSIGEDAFHGCSALTKAEFSSIESLCNISFYGWNSNPLTSAHHLFIDGKEVTNLEIPSSVTSIGRYAFAGCSGLTRVNIPNSVTSIGSYAFAGCIGLTKAEFSSIESLCKISFTDADSNPLYSAHLLYIDGKEVKNLVIPSSVTSIGDYTFIGCSDLKSVTIPSSVTNIGNYTFYGCYICKDKFVNNSSCFDSGNWGITLFDEETSDGLLIEGNSIRGCRSWATSITIPKYVTYISLGAFISCRSLTKVEFSSVESLCNMSFEYAGESGICSNPLNYAHHLYIDGKEVKNLVIPSSVTSIGDYTFIGCSGLTSVTIPSSVTSIGDCAFMDCSGLTSVTIPSSVTSIGYSAFIRCSGLIKAEFSSIESLCKISYGNSAANPLGYAKRLFIDGKEATDLVIPASVTCIGNYAFAGCKCTPLNFMGIPTEVEKYAFSGFDGYVFAPSEFKNTATNSGLSSSRFIAKDVVNWGEHVKTCLRGFTCFEPLAESVLNVSNIKFYKKGYGTPLSYTKSDDGYYVVNGLDFATSYNIEVTYIDGEGVNKSCEFAIKTKSPSFEITSNSTQSSVTVEQNYTVSDETCAPEKSGIVCNGIEYTEFPVVLSGLYPGEKVTVRPFAVYDGHYYYGSEAGETIYTKNIALSINFQGGPYASSLSINGSYTEGDAEITDEKMTINGKTYVGHVVTATGLDPNTEYKATYSLKANGHEFTTELPFTTPALTMVTKQPKVISAGNVIVAAEANIDEAETNVGFEWRREDWSEEFNSNVGGAYMYNGQMEGYIRNLYKEKLWKYRPYYLSDTGNYYYGDWVGIDPCNTSYFEATVHTYNQITVEGNTALVKGFALPGSDDITVQGFVYWKRVSNSNERDGRLHAASVPSDAKMVEAKGQVMTATLPDLDYSSEYCYTAFVTTRAGETFYGEEMTFQTGEDPMGIDDVVFDGALSEPVTILGYYDMNGRRIQEPQHGLYIIRYSDGSSRKLMRK